MPNAFNEGLMGSQEFINALTQNKYQPDALRIANALKQNELNFAPRMSAATLAEKQQMAPYYQALTGEANARIPFIGAQTKELLQKLMFPNIGSEGALGTIDYGRWLQQNHPELATQVQKNIPGTPAQQVTRDNPAMSMVSPLVGAILRGQQTQQTATGAPFLPQNTQTQIPGVPGFQTQTNIPATPESTQTVSQSIAQQLINSGLQQSQMKPNAMQFGRYGLGVGQKEIMGLQQQLLNEHSDWTPQMANQAASAYLAGDETLEDGTPLPKPSGIVQSTIAQIQKRNSNAQVQNKAANFKVLAEDLDSIDITPLKTFAGASGRLKFAQEMANMLAHRPTSEEFQKYMAFKDVTSNFAMDALRQGFGTSIVPEYVYATLGKASNPASNWWNSPELVDREWNTTKDWIKRNAKQYGRMATQGISARSDEKGQQQTAPAKSQSISQEDIAFTAKKYGISEDEVKRRLGVK